VLKEKDNSLFKRFSMLQAFESSEEFLNAFPTNKRVSEEVIKLKYSKDENEYISILKELDKNKEVKEYFDIVLDSHSDNK
jgi:hypothetical protein